MKLRGPAANPKVTELRRLAIFAGLGGRQLTALAQNLDEVTVPAGERVIQAGRHNEAFWILLEGEATLTLGGRIKEKLGRGDIFGLPSMFSGLTATADVVAVTALRVFVASHQQFAGLVSDHEVEIRFKAALFDRLRDEVYQLTRDTGGTAGAGDAGKSTPRAGRKKPPSA